MLMETFEKVTDLFTFWENVRNNFHNILKHVTTDDLSYAPNKAMKSLAEILTHIPAAYHWWLEYIIKDGKGIKPPSKPCKILSEIKSLFNSAHERLDEFMNRLSWQFLKNEYKVKQDNETKKITLFWILWHLVKHNIHHRAQIRLYLALMGKKNRRSRFL